MFTETTSDEETTRTRRKGIIKNVSSRSEREEEERQENLQQNGIINNICVSFLFIPFSIHLQHFFFLDI